MGVLAKIAILWRLVKCELIDISSATSHLEPFRSIRSTPRGSPLVTSGRLSGYTCLQNPRKPLKEPFTVGSIIRGSRTVAAIRCNSDAFGTKNSRFCVLPWHSSRNQAVFHAQKRKLWRKTSDSSFCRKFAPRRTKRFSSLKPCYISV